jgi:hypothetical protein
LHRHRYTSPVLVTLCALGCTEPRFAPRHESEAGAESPDANGPSHAADAATSPDAQGQHDAAAGAPLDWQAKLRGRYAVRAFSFARAGAPQSREDVLLVSIEAVGGELRLIEQTCASSFGWNAGSLVARAVLRSPEARSPRSLRVEYDGQYWSTLSDVYTHGYASSPPQACAGGASATPSAEQGWITGSCRCESGALPSGADDCRVTDPDGDDKPGFTLDVVVGGFPSEYYVVERQLDRYVNGTIAESGLHVAFTAKESQDALVGCLGTCDLTPPQACPPVGANYAWFAPLPELDAGGADWTCAAVMGALPELFRDRPAPAFPQGC